MLGLRQIHHIAITTTDYVASKVFYCNVPGFASMSEAYRGEGDLWKGNLALNGQYMIEFFSFLSPSCRPSRPEVCGLRHLAFNVEDTEKSIAYLEAHYVECESIRIDPLTGKCFTFFNNPDGLPLKLCEL